MHLFVAITCTTVLGIVGVFDLNQEPPSCPYSLSADVGEDIPEFTMTREDDFKEVEVSIPESHLKKLLRPMWRVEVELRNRTQGSSRTLLNVLIEQADQTVHFQLPRSHATNRSKEILFDSALNRSVDICPGQDIKANTTLTIRLSSTSVSPVLVKVKTALVEREGNWRTIAGKKMEIKSQFWFSNPQIHTVRFDEILPGKRDHYVNLRIESEENSPCFCSLLSVQRARCPYFDSIADAKRFGRWQTMDESTSMVIGVNDLTGGKKELLIVLIGAEDEVCNFVNKEKREEKCEGRKAIDGGLRKNVTITLEPTARTDDRLKATFIVAILYLGITIVCFVVSGFLFKFDI